MSKIEAIGVLTIILNITALAMNLALGKYELLPVNIFGLACGIYVFK